MARRLVRLSWIAAVCLVVLGSVTALAGETPPITQEGGYSFETLLKEIIHILVFSLLGLFILLIGFRALDLATPFSLNKEIAEDDNTSAGVVVAGMMVALGMIIHGALTSSFIGFGP